MYNRAASITRVALPIVLASWCAASAQTITINDPRPVDAATLILESTFGWPITYEDTPRVFQGDLEDVTAQVRRDGKSASEPGVMPTLIPHGGSFFFSLEDRPQLASGTRAPEAATRAAILEMLKGYSGSVGGVEMFALTDSNGVFHIVPTQRKSASGKLEKVVPVLDTVVNIPAGQRTAVELVRVICESVSSQTGVHVAEAVPANLFRLRKTQIASLPNESARSILSRLFAELAMPRPVSWHLLYQPGWGYALNGRLVNTSK
jgi:hypothetical protein